VEHDIGLGYIWVKQALQGAGLVKKRKKRTPRAGDGNESRYRGCCCTSTEASIADPRTTVIAVLDDATSEIWSTHSWWKRNRRGR
jgi:hypothetical protein